MEYQPPEVIAGLQLLKDPQQGCSLLLKAQLAPQAIQQQGVAIGIDWRGRPWLGGSGVALIEECSCLLAKARAFLQGVSDSVIGYARGWAEHLGEEGLSKESERLDGLGVR